MSVGRNLQEMENVVTKGAASADQMQGFAQNASGVMIPGQTGAWEDLGGPTPENYRPDDNSAMLKTPGATLAQVRDVVNAKASAADPMQALATGIPPGQGVAKEDAEYDEELVEEDEKEGGKEDQEEDKKEYGKKKPSKKEEDDKEEDEEEMEESYDIEEDVNALLEGEDLSEEFQEKARTIFEAAIRSRVAEIREDLQASYEEALVEEIQSIKESLKDRVDAYLEYVADEWIQDNALVIEHGLKTEMTESFLVGMKQLFEDHYVTVPEDRYDVIESMVDKLDEMEEKLNEQIERNVALNRRLAESVADVIFADVAEGLALSQKDKLASLAENVEFDSEANYREKLVTLRESYFPTNAGTQRDETENLSEQVSYNYEAQSVSPVMEAYLQTLSRVARK
jgi:hypothetical protein